MASDFAAQMDLSTQHKLVLKDMFISGDRQVEDALLHFESGDVDGLLNLLNAKLGKKGKFQYSSYILTPHYITKSTAAVASDYDGVWLGFSPDNKSMTSAVSYYLKNGMVGAPV